MGVFRAGGSTGRVAGGRTNIGGRKECLQTAPLSHRSACSSRTRRTLDASSCASQRTDVSRQSPLRSLICSAPGPPSHRKDPLRPAAPVDGDLQHDRGPHRHRTGPLSGLAADGHQSLGHPPVVKRGRHHAEARRVGKPHGATAGFKAPRWRLIICRLAHILALSRAVRVYRET